MKMAFLVLVLLCGELSAAETVPVVISENMPDGCFVQTRHLDSHLGMAKERAYTDPTFITAHLQQDPQEIYITWVPFEMGESGKSGIQPVNSQYNLCVVGSSSRFVGWSEGGKMKVKKKIFFLSIDFESSLDQAFKIQIWSRVSHAFFLYEFIW